MFVNILHHICHVCCYITLYSSYLLAFQRCPTTCRDNNKVQQNDTYFRTTFHEIHGPGRLGGSGTVEMPPPSYLKRKTEQNTEKKTPSSAWSLQRYPAQIWCDEPPTPTYQPRPPVVRLSLLCPNPLQATQSDPTTRKTTPHQSS